MDAEVVILKTRKSDLASYEHNSEFVDRIAYDCAYLYTFMVYEKAPICEFNDLDSVFPAEYTTFITKYFATKNQIELFDKFGESTDFILEEFVMRMVECSIMLSNSSINVDEQTKFVDLYNSQRSIFDQFEFLKSCINKI